MVQLLSITQPIRPSHKSKPNIHKSKPTIPRPSLRIIITMNQKSKSQTRANSSKAPHTATLVSPTATEKALHRSQSPAPMSTETDKTAPAIVSPSNTTTLKHGPAASRATVSSGESNTATVASHEKIAAGAAAKKVQSRNSSLRVPTLLLRNTNLPPRSRQAARCPKQNPSVLFSHDTQEASAVLTLSTMATTTGTLSWVTSSRF